MAKVNREEQEKVPIFIFNLKGSASALEACFDEIIRTSRLANNTILRGRAKMTKMPHVVQVETRSGY